MAVYANPFAAYVETKDRIANNRMAEQRNAMDMDRFKMQQAEMQAQADARRRAEETAALQGRGAQARYSGMFPNSQPAMPAQAPQMAAQGQAQLMTPMQGGAPIETRQPEIDPATGKPIDLAVVRDMQQQQLKQSDGIKREMEVYAQQGRWDLVGQIAPMYDQAVAAERKAGLNEEQQGYTLYKETMKQVGSWATSIIPRLEKIDPKSNWQPQVMASVQSLAENLNRMGLDGNVILQQVKIDPTDTPQSIAQELRDVAATAFSEDAAKRFFAKPDIVNTGREQLQVGGAGDVLNRFDVTVSPNTSAQVGATIRGQDIRAATTRRGQNMTDNRSIRSQQTNLPAGFILNGN